MQNPFITKIYNSDGILVKEVYNWYTIIGSSLLVIVISASIYIYITNTPPTPPSSPSSSISSNIDIGCFSTEHPLILLHSLFKVGI